MSIKADLETLDPADEVQNAYDQSNGSDELHPWTPDRQSAAMLMGCEIMDGKARDDLRKLSKTGIYPGVYRDVIIVNWLRALSIEEVIRINAHRDIERAIAEAFEWAKTEMRYGTPAYFDGLKFMIKEINNIFSSDYSFDDTRPGSNLKKSIVQPGKSGSSLRPSRPPANPPPTS